MVRILINLFSEPTRLSVIKDQICCWSHKSTVHNCRPSCCGCGCAAVCQPRGWLLQLNCTSQPIHCPVPSAASLWHNHLLLPPLLPVSTSPHLTSRDHSIFIQPSLVHADLLPTDEAAVGCRNAQNVWPCWVTWEGESSDGLEQCVTCSSYWTLILTCTYVMSLSLSGWPSEREPLQTVECSQHAMNKPHSTQCTHTQFDPAP